MLCKIPQNQTGFCSFWGECEAETDVQLQNSTAAWWCTGNLMWKNTQIWHSSAFTWWCAPTAPENFPLSFQRMKKECLKTQRDLLSFYTMCLQARGPKVMDWTVQDGGQEQDWPRTIWRLSQRRHQSSLSNHNVAFLRNKQMKSSRRVSEEAQRSAHIKGSLQRDKSLFLHPAHPPKSAAEGEWLVYISNFLVMAGFKIRAVQSKAATWKKPRGWHHGTRI